MPNAPCESLTEKPAVEQRNNNGELNCALQMQVLWVLRGPSWVETFAPLSRTNSVACSNWKCFFGLQKGSSPLTGCASSSPKTHRSVQKAKEKVWGIQGPLVGCAPSYPLPISFI